MIEHKASERGQIVILLALVLLVLLAFAALAIDGGMVYSNRRYTQSVADSASLAGAGKIANDLNQRKANGSAVISYENFSCSDSLVVSAMTQAINEATLRASANNYVLDNDISDGHGVQVVCNDVGNGTGYQDKYIDVIVKMVSQTDTAFAHLVYGQPLEYNVESVTRVYLGATLGLGNAIVSLSPNCGTNQGGITYDGNLTITVDKGQIFSFSCMIKNGGVSVSAINSGPNPIQYTTTWTDNGSSGFVSPAPSLAPGPLALPPFAPLDAACATLPDRGNHHGPGTLDPGRYGQIRVPSSNHVLRLKPGLYCVSDGIVINGQRLESISFGGKDGVTIYLTGGDFSVAGSAVVNLSAPINMNQLQEPAVFGLLFFMKPGHTGSISLVGNSGSSYTGTVYAPDGFIEAGGNTSVNPTLNTQLIGWDIKLHGNANLYINFDRDLTAQNAPHLSLLK